MTTTAKTPEQRAAHAEQARAALKKANAVRIRTAELKRAVKAGDVKLADLILDIGEPEHLELAYRQELRELLEWQDKWGRARARKALWSAGIQERALIGHLTNARRKALIRAMAAAEGRPLPDAEDTTTAAAA